MQQPVGTGWNGSRCETREARALEKIVAISFQPSAFSAITHEFCCAG
jgi:hypothetical protein